LIDRAIARFNAGLARTSAALMSFSKPTRDHTVCLVTVRPPHAIPGVADVEVLTTSEDVRDVHIVPLPLTGAGAQFAPVPDRATRSVEDPKLFHRPPLADGRRRVAGPHHRQRRSRRGHDVGAGADASAIDARDAPGAAISSDWLLAAARRRTRRIVSAMAREAKLGAGEALDPRARRRGRIAGAIATAVVAESGSSATCGGPSRRPPTIATSTSRWSRRRD
jgi:hypothetical protein